MNAATRYLSGEHVDQAEIIQACRRFSRAAFLSTRAKHSDRYREYKTLKEWARQQPNLYEVPVE